MWSSRRSGYLRRMVLLPRIWLCFVFTLWALLGLGMFVHDFQAADDGKTEDGNFGCFSSDDSYFGVGVDASQLEASANVTVVTFHAGWRLVPRQRSWISGLFLWPSSELERQRVPLTPGFRNWRRSLHIAGFSPSSIVTLGGDYVWGLDESANWRHRTEEYLDFVKRLDPKMLVVNAIIIEHGCNHLSTPLT